ncbi:MAG: EppA_BapA family protein [candidate division Zixibacteria bacterium RBG-1]|nr:MAG: EppA_BapA family protein [candidate division Zixibacteria bacterium RBG-1]
MQNLKKLLIVISSISVVPSLIFAQKTLSPSEVASQYQKAFYYSGKDMKALVYMQLIESGGKERVRELTMLRKNTENSEEQKYFIYFHQPADVEGMTFMVYKYPQKDDDRWLFMPALDLVKRIAANDRRSSFVGSDFTYEDVSGRDLAEDNFSIEKEEKIGGKDCYVLKSAPKNPKSADYSYKLSWIDKVTFLPLKEEYYDIRGELYKLFIAEEVKDVSGFPTVTKRKMVNVKSQHQTLVTFKDIQYNLGIDKELFTERYLKRPPSKWIK